MKTKKKPSHTPLLNYWGMRLDPDKLCLVRSSAGGVNIRDGHGNVPIARVYKTPGWEARARLYLAAEDLFLELRSALAELEVEDILRGLNPKGKARIASLRAAIGKTTGEGREAKP